MAHHAIDHPVVDQRPFALFPQISSPTACRLTEQMLTFFNDRNLPLVIDDTYASQFQAPPFSSVDPTTLKLIITMGGDGSILHIAHQYLHLGTPLLGINLGHLGFMADLKQSDLFLSLEQILEDHYTIEKRLILQGTGKAISPFLAINDCVLHRAHNPKLIDFSLYVDDKLLNTFEADGIILATPNGSTAYSLSAGGPIVSPHLQAIVITPICAHTISNRPIVIESEAEVRVVYHTGQPPCELTIDGLICFPIEPGTNFTVKKEPEKGFNLARLNTIDHFSTWRTKLGWGRKLRQKSKHTFEPT